MTESHRRARLSAISILCAAAMAACGGGGDGAADAPGECQKFCV